MNAASASPSFLNKNDPLFKYAKKISAIQGFEDVVVHGDAFGFVFKDADGREYNVSVDEFASILRHSGLYQGGNIRLIACESGAPGSVTAQALADILGVSVLAPDDVVFVFPDGEMIIAPDSLTALESGQTGQWVLFEPKSRKDS